jgi:adenylosuccinate lyase
MATETILMQAVQRGADRQAVHEQIRQASHAAAAGVKEGRENDLLERLQRAPDLAGLDWERLCDPQAFVGRAPEQVTEFVAEVIDPICQRYRGLAEASSEVQV